VTEFTCFNNAYDVRNIEQFVKEAYNSAETKSAEVGIWELDSFYAYTPAALLITVLHLHCRYASSRVQPATKS